MKLVTECAYVSRRLHGILIHTSVKLVTGILPSLHPRRMILIHTSVKLVTILL